MRKKRPASQPERRRVLILDDHPITREGMTQLINGEADLQVCAEFCTAEEALKAMERSRPDVVVTDLTLPGKDGLELIKDLGAIHPELPVLVVSMHDEAIYAERTLRAGARGYLMKQESSEKVLVAIRTVLDGKIYVSQAMSSKMLEMYSERSKHNLKSSIAQLSDREFEIFHLLGQGAPVKEIAVRLHISPKTVEAHRGHIKEKLSMATSNDLTVYAVRWVESERP